MSLTLALLIAAVVALLAGPFLLRSRSATPSWKAALDGFVIVTVGGIAALHLLPESFGQGGLTAMGFAVVGAFLPTLIERRAARAGALVLVGALLPHAVIESAALGAADESHVLGLGIAVAAHRLPIGLVLFATVERQSGARWGWAAVGALIVATLVGFGAGESLAGSISHEQLAWLTALVGGSLLHVVFSHGLHETHVPAEEAEHGCCGGHSPEAAHVHPGWAAGGALAGGAILVIALSATAGHGDHAGAHRFMDTFAKLAFASAPALLIAFLLAGLVGALITPARASWLGRASRPGQAARGVLFGLPLPICSCGVLPLYETLMRRGVPPTAGLGFLIATPELGLDAILLSVPLLGADLTVARLVAAFLVAMAVALFVGRMVKHTEGTITPEPEETPPPLNVRVRNGLAFGLGELFDKTIPWILAGLLIAAWVEPLLGHSLLREVPPAVQVPLFALIGIPVYVCASGATPIAAVAILAHVSPGAGIAFLLAGPATNVTTFGILSQLHGRRVAIGFGAAVFLGAIASGLVVDALGVTIVSELVREGHDHISWTQWAALAGIGLLFVVSLYRQGPRGMTERIHNPLHSH